MTRPPRVGRVRVARILGLVELIAAGAIVLAIPVVVLVRPRSFGMTQLPSIDGVAAVLAVAGVVWMVRVWMADPEAGPSHWRYRD